MEINTNLSQTLTRYNNRFEAALAQYLPHSKEDSTQLYAAMHYAVNNGGKRLRPTLVYAVGECLGVPLAHLDAAACSIEFIHAYSLIHDDLPAMDNSDLRRGKPACHIAFDEATAILAGDCLQTLAFDILISQQSADINSQQRLSMLQMLAHVSGAGGMGGGQALDLLYTGKTVTEDELAHMYSLKTGALIQASIELPTLIADLSPDVRQSLATFGKWLGLAFQIHDDILDCESDTTTLGKPQNLDLINDKCTYPALLGIKIAKQRVVEYRGLALSDLNACNMDVKMLNYLAEYITRREK